MSHLPSKERMPHWTCKTHGDFDARVAVGCPDCVRQMRDELQNLRRENVRWENAHKILLSEIDRLKRPAHEREPPHCSTCACGLTPEPAADAAEAMLEAGRQVYGGGWIDHGPECNDDGCSCGLESWLRRYHKLLKLDISHWPPQPPPAAPGVIAEEDC